MPQVYCKATLGSSRTPHVARNISYRYLRMLKRTFKMTFNENIYLKTCLVTQEVPVIQVTHIGRTNCLMIHSHK